MELAIGKRPANIRVGSVCDLVDKRLPTLVFIDATALCGDEATVAEIVAPLQQSAWRDTPIVILDNPEADIVRGYAAGYVARIRIDEKPHAIERFIERVLSQAQTR
ncbi:MAG: hypothetical protein WHS44_05885 [Fimbriimonadales bacterium]|nr:MAG: hypothetical protein KatS3mg018_0954 [Fimbriimonadales bacterium]